ncbi:MAG: HD domain-containing protein [Clostridia bacterium]|nr:HD domain-containing protein [Clostridia bacterium]
MQSRPQPQLSTVIKGQIFEGFLLVKSSEQRTASNGSKYLDMTLCDKSSEINAKMWDGTVAAPKVGQVVKVRGMMQEYNNRAQLRTDKLREPEPRDEVDMSTLVPCAPEPAQSMKDELYARANAIKDAQLRALVVDRLDACGDKLDYYPAAVKLHHAERSGLLHHTTTMLRAARGLCEVYKQLDADLLAAGIILHDLCKLTEIKASEIGIGSEYSIEGELIGHLVEGVARLESAGERLGVRRELLLMVEHMILSHHDLPEYGSPKRPMFPEAEVLHTLDMLDARMFEMTLALEQVQPGAFTERIWSLERKLYRRKN